MTLLSSSSISSSSFRFFPYAENAACTYVSVHCTLISKFQSRSMVKMLYIGGHLQNSQNMWQILIQVHVTLDNILTVTGHVLQCCNRTCAVSWLNCVFLDANIIMPELQYNHQQCRTRTFGSYFWTVRLMELYTYEVILKRNL